MEGVDESRSRSPPGSATRHVGTADGSLLGEPIETLQSLAKFPNNPSQLFSMAVRCGVNMLVAQPRLPDFAVLAVMMAIEN
jgi:hypothetical protein